MRANSKEVVVTLTAELWEEFRRRAAALGVPVEWLVAGLVCDTVEGLAACRLTDGAHEGFHVKAEPRRAEGKVGGQALQEGYDERRLPFARHDETRQPLQRQRLVPRQIAQVSAGGYQECVDAGGLGRLRRAL